MGERMMKVAKEEKITMVRDWRPIAIRKLSNTEFPAYTNCTAINPAIIATSSNKFVFIGFKYSTIFTNYSLQCLLSYPRNKSPQYIQPKLLYLIFSSFPLHPFLSSMASSLFLIPLSLFLFGCRASVSV